MDDVIRWPPSDHPDRSDVHARNEQIVHAEPEQIWNWLVRAPYWPHWYRNAWFVRLDGGAHRLGAGTTFRWTTFGTRISSQVVDFDPPNYIGWLWWRRGARGYHGWILTRLGDGRVRVTTAETQRGAVPHVLHRVLQPALYAAHAYWLRRLAKKAPAGPPG